MLGGSGWWNDDNNKHQYPHHQPEVIWIGSAYIIYTHRHIQCSTSRHTHSLAYLHCRFNHQINEHGKYFIHENHEVRAYKHLVFVGIVIVFDCTSVCNSTCCCYCVTSFFCTHCPRGIPRFFLRVFLFFSWNTHQLACLLILFLIRRVCGCASRMSVLPQIVGIVNCVYVCGLLVNGNDMYST